jgi:hypothetical protein
MPDCAFTLDDCRPYHGKVSWRIRAKDRQRKISTVIAPQHNKPEEYTLSIYLRADRPEAKASWGLAGQQWVLPPLTTEWKRYEQKVTIPPNMTVWDAGAWWLAIQPDSTVWVDALQLEKGGMSTEFEP